MNQILERLSSRFAPVKIGDWLAHKIPDVVAAAFVVILFWLGWKLLRGMLGGVLRRADVDETARAFHPSNILVSRLGRDRFSRVIARVPNICSRVNGIMAKFA